MMQILPQSAHLDDLPLHFPDRIRTGPAAIDDRDRDVSREMPKCRRY
jgi:hypothetical protein